MYKYIEFHVLHPKIGRRTKTVKHHILQKSLYKINILIVLSYVMKAVSIDEPLMVASLFFYKK